MSSYKRYRTRKLIEAKQVDHAFGVYDPVTSKRQEGQAGDYLVKDGNKQWIEPRERFQREYEFIGE